MDITIVIPGIRPERWLQIYHELVNSVGKYSFELICVGPNMAPNELYNYTNFKYIRDFGSPSRCLQIGCMFSNSEFLCWIPDDCILTDSGLEVSLDYMYKNSSEDDGMCLLYSEGINFTGNQDTTPSYWIGSTHEDQRKKWVNPDWKIAPLFLYRKKLFNLLGGIDCRFEHANLNTHDLAYRVQKRGGIIHLSPQKILSVSWIPGQEVVTQAHFENDIPLFDNLYSGEEPPRTFIDILNWKESSNIWKRRFK